MNYGDDTSSAKHGPRAPIRSAIQQDIQQKLPMYFQEMVAARHNGRSANDITRALWPDVAFSGGGRLRP